MWRSSRDKSSRFVGPKTKCALGLGCDNYGIGAEPLQYDGGVTLNEDAESLMWFHVTTTNKGVLKRAG